NFKPRTPEAQKASQILGTIVSLPAEIGRELAMMPAESWGLKGLSKEVVLTAGELAAYAKTGQLTKAGIQFLKVRKAEVPKMDIPQMEAKPPTEVPQKPLTTTETPLTEAVKAEGIVEPLEAEAKKYKTADEFVAGIDLNNPQIIDVNKIKPIVTKPDDMYLSPRFDEGIKVPILVDKKTGLIEDGNHRYFAAIKRGDKTIPVIYVDELPIHLRKKIVETTKSQLTDIWNKANKAKVEPQGKGETTSIRNAEVDAEREARGLPPIETPVTERPTDWKTTIEAEVDSGIRDPKARANRINNQIDIGERPTEITDDVNYELAYDKARMKSELKSIETALEENPSGELEARRDVLEDALAANEKATKAIGTEQGRALQSRQEDVDYSVAGMLNRAREDGEIITPEVRKKYKQLSANIEKAQTDLEEFKNQTATENLDKTLKQVQNEEGLTKRKQKREYKTEELDIEFDNLINEFAKNSGNQLGSMLGGIDIVNTKLLVEMTRNRIRKGIVKAEDIVDSIYTSLVNAGIEYSKRDIRDAISKYGQIKEMSKEEIDVALREAKRQMQLISAFEDARKGIVPSRSGWRRDKQSDRERELRREVHQAMREAGINTTRTPAEQWKTSLDAIKSRLKNSVADLVKRFETGQKEPKKIGIEYDEQATELKNFRDKIQEVLDFAEGKKEKTPQSPEQRIRMATAAVEKSIAEYERKITENDLATKKKGSTTPETPELKRLRSERDLLKDIYKEMQNEAKPKKSPDDVALEAFRKRKERQIAEYERRVKEKDFAPKKRKELKLGDKEMALQLAEYKAKAAYAKARFENTLANRSTLQKIGAGVFEAIALVKALKSSYDVSAVGRQGFFAFIAHPVMSSKNIPAMFRALKSEDALFQIDQSIMKRKNYSNYMKGELSLTKMGESLKEMEEAFQSRWAEK
ncbi:MAG: hypothetical protein ABII22_07140, partial [Candidatus Micrarchaeota archaeon]